MSRGCQLMPHNLTFVLSVYFLMRCLTHSYHRSLFNNQIPLIMTAFSDSRKSQLQLMKQSPCFNSFGRTAGITRSEMTHVYRKGDGVIHWNLERISTPGESIR
jgi:hypothetical protein